ncbi:MAG: hypothetical protein WAK55_04120 [Xanthobacteraceae bacterium]
MFGAFSWTGIGVDGGSDGGFSFGAFSCGGIGEAGGGESGCSFGAFSWTGIGMVGNGDNGFFFWTGICIVGGGDGGFLFEAFPCAVGRAPNFRKYKLQVVDSSMRRESRHFNTSFSLRAPAQRLCISGPHDARRVLPIVAGELPTVTGAARCVAGPSISIELEPAVGVAAARPAELFLARRTQALNSAQARFVSGE